MKNLCLALPALLLAVTAGAQSVIFETNFDGANGSTPAGFQLLEPATTAYLRIENNEYRATRNPSALNMTSIYAPDASAYALSNYTVSTTFRAGAHANSVFVGLVSHYTNASNFYQARMIGTETADTWKLQIYKTVNNATSLLGESTVFEYPRATSWTLSFTVNDGELSAILYDNTSQIIASLLDIQDASLSSGTAGVRVTPPGGSAIVYENFRVTSAVVPEPSSVGAVLALVAVGAAVVLRRRRSGTAA